MKMKSDAIFDHLKSRILSGEFDAVAKLPSEKEFSDFYGCSRPTLRKALESLEKERLITRRQGAGSFLTQRHDDALIQLPASGKGSAMFGVILPSLGDNYVFNFICSELSRLLAAVNCSLVWGGTIDPQSPLLVKEVEQICKKYVELKVDGVFFAPLEYTPLRDQLNNYIIDVLKKANIPVVLIDSDYVEFPQRSNYDLVSLNHIQASYLLTHHMREQKAKQVHFVSPPMSAKTIKLRQMGFREALYDTRTSSSTTLIHEGDPKDLDFVASIVEMGAEGILCSNDGTAITLLQSLAKLNLEVPKDLIVAGFDNLSYLSQIKTPLTSVAQPLELISSEAVRLMFERLDNRDRPTKTTSFSGILIERESTRSQQVGGRNS